MDTPALRIVDASLNRAGEGLRVVEDYARFVLDDAGLARQAKEARHALAGLVAAVPSAARHAARDTRADVGTGLSTPAELERGDAWAVCAASLKRVEQALRSAEEYGKLIAPTLGPAAERLRYQLYTLEKSLDTARDSVARLQGVSLCVLVDGRDGPEAFEALVGGLVGAGVGMIQLRDKGLDGGPLTDLARRLTRMTRGTPTLAIVNDRADVAAAAHADGVHVGQTDLSVKDARAVVGPRALVGVSTHNLAQVRRAVLDGANYLGAGPAFPSRTKHFEEHVGVGFLRQAAEETRLPLFGIGGIGHENLAEVLAAGVHRVAVAGAVVDAPEPAGAAAELLRKLSCGSGG